MKKINLLKLTLIPSLSLVAFSSIAITSASCGKRKVDQLIVHAIEDAIVKLINDAGNNPNLSYSFNCKKWDEYKKPISLSAGEDLYLKGNNPNGFSTSYRNCSYFSFDGKVSIGGSVMSLLDDGSASMSEIPNEYCFYCLFQDCSTIISVDKDFLKSAETLKNNCYGYMFQNCTALENAPELPAKTLVHNCYDYMFQNCESLKQAPDLPAMTLVNGCYFSMFSGCTSLENAPKLPATTLAEDCYGYMFFNCRSLKNAPELPATTLAEDWHGCYQYMFCVCSSLSFVKIGYTGDFDQQYFERWVEGVADSGTFYYNGSQVAEDFGLIGWETKRF